MNLAPSSVKGFACFEEPFDSELFSELVCEYTLSVMSAVFEAFRVEGTLDPATFEAMLRCGNGLSYESLWLPEVGLCMAGLRTQDAALALRGLAQLALNQSIAGAPGSWGMRFSDSCPLRWDRYVLPSTSAIEVNSDGVEARVLLHSEQGPRTFSLSREDGTNWIAEGAETLACYESGKFRSFLLTGDQCKAFHLPNPVLEGVLSITDAHIDHLRQGLALFDRVFPNKSAWFDRVIRYISLAQPPPEGIHSGSNEGYFGIVSMSDSDDPFKIAETLVHEASHQYLFLLQRFDDTVKNDGRLFYSPFVKRDRPPERVLLGYHAFTNVEIFYRKCSELGFEPERCKRALAQFDQELGFVESILSSQVEFSELGRSIFDTLTSYRSVYAAQN